MPMVYLHVLPVKKRFTLQSKILIILPMALAELALMADIHMGAADKYPDSYPDVALWETYFTEIKGQLQNTKTDALVIAGDLTHDATIAQAKALAPLLGQLDTPKIAVKGNHDFRGDYEAQVQKIFEEAGVVFLDEEYTVLTINGKEIAFYGFSGFPGKVEETETTKLPLLEDRMRQNHAHTEKYVSKLHHALIDLDAKGIPTVVITHYAPTGGTIDAEFPFAFSPNLSPLIAAEIDQHKNVQLIVHGHTHDRTAPFRGFPSSTTPGGIPIENVAAPMLLRLSPVVNPPVVRRSIQC